MIILIVIMILYVHTYEELIYQFDAAINGLEEWKNYSSSDLFFQQDEKLYGGSNPRISRAFQNLGPHYQVQIQMEFWLINLLQEGVIKVYLDEKIIYSRIYIIGDPTSLYGPTTFGQYYDIIKVQYPQKKRTASIYIEVTGLPSCGIRTFKFYIERCPEGCDVCDNYDYLDCKKWRIFMQNFNQYQYSSLQGWSTEQAWSLQIMNLCAQCHFLLQNEIQYIGVLPPHQGLMIKIFLYLDFGSQIILINGVQYIVSQPTEFYQSELIINQHKEQQLFILIKFGYIRDFELYYQIEEIYSDPLILGCQFVQHDICLSCLDGWEFDEIQNQCHPQCGDHLIQGLEVCDDGNQIQNDGCYQCKFECEAHCVKCEFSICQECQSGYLVSTNQNISPQCYLDIVNQEQSEEEEEEEFEFQDNCIVLEEHLCRECIAGYFQQNGYCIPYCEDGFEFIDQFCTSICGDGFITNLEECDDQNDVPYDGCYECQFSCPQYCLECLNGYCQQCDAHFQLQSNNLCNFIQIEQQKECDDQNSFPVDGCHKFQIQLDWVCRKLIYNTFSECSYFKYPKLHIQYEKMSWNTQYLQLIFNQPIKVIHTRFLIEAFTYSIQNLSESQYNINVLSNQDISRNLAIVEYNLEIEIYQLLKFKPILIVNLSQNITNQYDSKVQIQNYSIALQFPTYLDDSQRYYSQVAQKSNRYLLFSFGGASALSIFQGRYEVLIEIVNLLSFQNYLRYINVRFPQNLLFYFEAYDLLSIETIINLLNIQQLDRTLFYKEFKETSGKFKFYEQNADLITNLEWQIIQTLLYLLLIILSIGIKQFIKSNYFSNRVQFYFTTVQHQSNKECTCKFLLWLYKKCQWIIEFGKILSLNGIKGILLVNGWDLMFKGMLYLKYLQDHNFKDIFSLILALVLLLFYLIFILNSSYLYSKNNYIRARKLKERRFKAFDTLVQICFITCLIFLESSEILQIGLISLINLLKLTLIYNYRKSRGSFFVQMVIQSQVLIFTLSSFVYIQEAVYYLSEDFKIKYGWFHILILSFSVLIELLTIIAQQIKQYFRQSKKKQSPRKENQSQKVILFL